MVYFAGNEVHFCKFNQQAMGSGLKAINFLIKLLFFLRCKNGMIYHKKCAKREQYGPSGKYPSGVV